MVGVLSGLPTFKREICKLLIVQAYIDESGGKGQGSVFVFSALLASAKDWDGFSNEWQSRLDEHPKIKYFKMHEAARRKGEFEGWSIEGRPAVVTVRGQVVVREGNFVGQPGSGRMLKRDPGYF